MALTLPIYKRHNTFVLHLRVADRQIKHSLGTLAPSLAKLRAMQLLEQMAFGPRALHGVEVWNASRGSAGRIRGQRAACSDRSVCVYPQFKSCPASHGLSPMNRWLWVRACLAVCALGEVVNRRSALKERHCSLGIDMSAERCVIPPRSCLSCGSTAAHLRMENTMSTLTRFNPFSELRDPFGDDFFKGFAMRPMHRLMEGEPQMRLDVTEDDKNFFVKAEIPGVKKEDIKVSLAGNQVSLSAEVKKEKEEKDGAKVIRSERYYGSVARSFTLDESVDSSAALAKYENGVLQLTLPKKPNGQSHLLKIS
jgi:HSP20 family protein